MGRRRGRSGDAAEAVVRRGCPSLPPRQSWRLSLARFASLATLHGPRPGAVGQRRRRPRPPRASVITAPPVVEAVLGAFCQFCRVAGEKGGDGRRGRRCAVGRGGARMAGSGGESHTAGRGKTRPAGCGGILAEIARDRPRSHAAQELHSDAIHRLGHSSGQLAAVFVLRLNVPDVFALIPQFTILRSNKERALYDSNFFLI